MSGEAKREPRFPLGRVVATPGALAALGEAGVEPLGLLQRHASGDWGAVCAEDAASNERALTNGWRIISAYEVGGARIWVITESDRRSTCLLLPSEY
jgi:hypothetical protein